MQWQSTHFPTILSDLTRYVGKHVTSRWFNVQNLLHLTELNDKRVAPKSFEAKAFSLKILISYDRKSFVHYGTDAFTANFILQDIDKFYFSGWLIF